MTLDEEARARIADLEARGLRRQPMVCSSTQGPTVEFEHRDVVLLCSNDYLGLADHPALRQSLAHASAEHGPGAAASRLISGTHEIHRKAERRLATLTRMPAALLFSSGYAANVGVLSSLSREGDVIFSDALNHASIIDGCRLSKARVIVYPHGDVDALSRSLQRERSKASAAYVVTDALFSMDGDLAPLVALRELATRFDAALLVDEAHSVGVLGPDGAGACASVGVVPDLLVGTLGKAMGLWGAFVASTPAVLDLLENTARSFVFSTATSPAASATCVTACDLVRDADTARAQLLRNAARLREGLRSRGWDVPASDAQIVPVVLGPAELTMQISAALLELGFFVQGIRPPTVAEGTSRLRLAPMATHDDDVIDSTLAAFASVEHMRPG